MPTTFDLSNIAFAFCEENSIPLSYSQCQRIVLKVIRIMEREHIRIHEVHAVTSDDYKTITHSDPTGEAAVRNVLAEIRRKFLATV